MKKLLIIIAFISMHHATANTINSSASPFNASIDQVKYEAAQLKRGWIKTQHAFVAPEVNAKDTSNAQILVDSAKSEESCLDGIEDFNLTEDQHSAYTDQCMDQVYDDVNASIASGNI